MIEFKVRPLDGGVTVDLIIIRTSEDVFSATQAIEKEYGREAARKFARHWSPDPKFMRAVSIENDASTSPG